MAKILNSTVKNIPWQDRPANCTDPVWRYTENPIIDRSFVKEANSILKSAADRVTQMVSEHEISKQAEAHAKEIIEKAQAEAKSMRAATKQYVTGALDELEKTIGDALERVRQARS